MGSIRREWGLSAWLCSARLVAWRLSTVGLERLPPRAPRRGAPAGPQAELEEADLGELAQRFLDGLGAAVPPMGPPFA